MSETCISAKTPLGLPFRRHNGRREEVEGEAHDTNSPSLPAVSQGHSTRDSFAPSRSIQQPTHGSSSSVLQTTVALDVPYFCYNLQPRTQHGSASTKYKSTELSTASDQFRIIIAEGVKVVFTKSFGHRKNVEVTKSNSIEQFGLVGYGGTSSLFQFRAFAHQVAKKSGTHRTFLPTVQSVLTSRADSFGNALGFRLSIVFDSMQSLLQYLRLRLPESYYATKSHPRTDISSAARRTTLISGVLMESKDDEEWSTRCVLEGVSCPMFLGDRTVTNFGKQVDGVWCGST